MFNPHVGLLHALEPASPKSFTTLDPSQTTPKPHKALNGCFTNINLPTATRIALRAGFELPTQPRNSGARSGMTWVAVDMLTGLGSSRSSSRRRRRRPAPVTPFAGFIAPRC